MAAPFISKWWSKLLTVQVKLLVLSKFNPRVNEDLVVIRSDLVGSVTFLKATLPPTNFSQSKLFLRRVLNRITLCVFLV